MSCPKSPHHLECHEAGLSTSTDSAYCTELSRRTAARAALHLGIEGMETAALDVLGSVLLAYMESVGGIIARNVEDSGRSSAHVNAYDVLNAVEGCTAAAASRGVSPQFQLNDDGIEISHQQQQASPAVRIQHAGRGWEGLASFLFGSNWFSIRLDGEDDMSKSDNNNREKSPSSTSSTINAATTTNVAALNSSTNAIANSTTLNGKGKGKLLSPTPASKPSTVNAKSGKGKQLANMTPPPGVSLPQNDVSIASNTASPEKNVTFALNNGHGTTASLISTAQRRWDAPFPSEVPSFPLLTHTNHTANPHHLSNTHISGCMHNLATETEACRDTHGGTTFSSSSNSKKQRRGSLTTLKDWKQDIADLKLKIPKDVFATKDIIWGCLKEGDKSDKVKKNGENGNVHSSSGSVGISSRVVGGVPQLPPVKMPSYVPNFFPPFPRTEESISSLPAAPTSVIMTNVLSRVSQKRKAPYSVGGDDCDGQTASMERNNVRQSLVELGKNAVGSSYWGSTWHNGHDDKISRKSTEKLKSNHTAGQLSVSAGPSFSATSVRPSESNKKGGGSTDAQVVPLARASGSRVAKILEGSN